MLGISKAKAIQVATASKLQPKRKLDQLHESFLNFIIKFVLIIEKDIRNDEALNELRRPKGCPHFQPLEIEGLLGRVVRSDSKTFQILAFSRRESGSHPEIGMRRNFYSPREMPNWRGSRHGTSPKQCTSNWPGDADKIINAKTFLHKGK